MFLELCVLAVEHSFVSDVEMTFGFFYFTLCGVK